MILVLGGNDKPWTFFGGGDRSKQAMGCGDLNGMSLKKS